MLKEEKYIEKRFGKINSFKVPDTYFADFAEKMKERLPVGDPLRGEADGVTGIQSRTSHRARTVALRRWIGGVAAGLFVASFSLGTYLHSVNGSKGTAGASRVESVTAQSHSDYNIDAFVDYSMMDTDDMYAYMSDAI